MMKILMIAPQPFFEPRGTPISVYQRLEALSVLGYQVDLLTYHVGHDVSIPGVAVHRCPRVPCIKQVRIGPSWSKALLDILLLFQAIVLLGRNEYDVIHSHEEAAFWSVPLSKVFHTRHIYDMHSSLPQQLASFSGWNLWPFLKLFEVFERWVINTCDVVITIGADLQERVMEVNPEVTTVLVQNLAVQTNDAGSGQTLAHQLREQIRLDGKLVVVYTGNFEQYQGLDLLLKSAGIVKEHRPDVFFVMVGGEPQQVRRWQDQVSASGLSDYVLFTGSVPLAEAIAYLDLAEILVSPRIERTSVPLKIYSYLHSGKPIVATDLAAHSHVLNNEIAVLVPPTAEAFAQGILILAQSAGLRESMGLRGQQFARERFKPADYLAKLQQVYQKPTLSTPPSEQAAVSSQSDQARSPEQRWLRLP